MRLLAAVRLSELTDETTSPERQREKILTYARLHGHDIVGVAEDLDVSGAVSPFDRPSLGPWLTGSLADEWDGLIVARLDRLTRSLFDFLELWYWLDNRGKALVRLEPSLDMTTPAGRAFAHVIAVFAEFERETIRDRVRGTYHYLRRNGKYTGGSIPFGYMPVRAEPKGWKLVPDPELAPVVREMVGRYLAGESFHQIKDWLNKEKVPASRDALRQRSGKPLNGKPWTSSPVRRVLSSPHLVGHLATSSGEPVRDEDGIAVTITPLLDEDTYAKLQAALRDRAYNRRVNASRLLGVASCTCGAPLYVSVTKFRGKEFRYYQCHASRFRRGGCTAKRIRAGLLERMTEAAFLASVGGVEVLEPVPVAGEDHAAELRQVEEAITNLEDQYVTGALYAGAAGAERFAAMMARLEERRAKVAALPCRLPRTDWRPTGRTFAQRWEDLDDNGRRLLMVQAGFRIRAAMKDGRLVLELALDPDLARRAGLAASDADPGKPSGEPTTVLRYQPGQTDVTPGPGETSAEDLAQRLTAVQLALEEAERCEALEQVSRARPLSMTPAAVRSRRLRAERKARAAASRES